MKRIKNNKEQVYKSIVEFEKKFFPKSFKKKSEARALGTNLAKESLNAIRLRLSK